MKQRKQDQGFTLVEVLVVAPIMSLTIAVLAAMLVTLYTDLTFKTGQMELETRAQSALFTMRDDLFYSLRFAGKQQADITNAAANPPSGTQWNAITHNALIVYEPSYTANRQTPGRQLIYKANAPHDCASSSIDQNQLATNTIIYFRKANTLYRRVLLPDQALNCAATFRAGTCPVATPSCPGDTVISHDVDSFTLTYYDKSGNVLTVSDLQSAPDKFIQVQRTDVRIALKRMIAGKTSTATASISMKAIE